MLTENDVANHTAKYLRSQGFEVQGISDTNTHGPDIVASKGDVKLFVEAKGQTSSKSYTNRYGKEFTPNQKWDHVSKAI
jgi:Holliday junction resolvase